MAWWAGLSDRTSDFEERDHFQISRSSRPGLRNRVALPRENRKITETALLILTRTTRALWEARTPHQALC